MIKKRVHCHCRSMTVGYKTTLDTTCVLIGQKPASHCAGKLLSNGCFLQYCFVKAIDRIFYCSVKTPAKLVKLVITNHSSSARDLQSFLVFSPTSQLCAQEEKADSNS